MLRWVLLAKLAGAMKASLTQAAYLFAAPLSQAARTIDALRIKQEEGAAPEAAAQAADSTTAAATTDGDAPAEDAPAAEPAEG